MAASNSIDAAGQARRPSGKKKKKARFVSTDETALASQVQSDHSRVFAHYQQDQQEQSNCSRASFVQAVQRYERTILMNKDTHELIME